MIRQEDTICAPATGSGGAVSVIRMSGSRSLEILTRIFYPADRSVDLLNKAGYSLIYGDIKGGEDIIDDVLVSIFRAPRSYTGEDSVEISCHASPYIIKKILELLVINGASTAAAGEFTRRAFINGRMDLSQAEAVADIIASTSKASHRIAINQMRGGFSEEIRNLRAELLNFASLIELELDFGEEDVEFADRNNLKDIVIRIKLIADKLASSFIAGNAIKKGIPVAIAGKPNSGKSTLLNALLMEERAIVSDIPGTTRDSIEETVHHDGIEYRFIDTAGLRETTDFIENLGIQKTYEKIKQASIVLFIDDVMDGPEIINRRIDALKEFLNPDQKLIIVINKTDKVSPGEISGIHEKILAGNKDVVVFISAKNKTGLDELRKSLGDSAITEKLNSNEVIISNIRHYEALRNVSESLGRVLEGLENSIPEDIIAIDIRQAIHYLGEITGEITSDEILGNIFKNFCIGK
ncbi:MAG TPA: tRNA uridine-5-carboxymethylaminomethyl(34) synthesis GTPase MnmE [Bacteroidales bacterium]|nr:tRNA uridine-5-carboxymethylaminomethyl(34) synthesis GTPase MnmE [Bacteroidales bacterium]